MSPRRGEPFITNPQEAYGVTRNPRRDEEGNVIAPRERNLVGRAKYWSDTSQRAEKGSDRMYANIRFEGAPHEMFDIRTVHGESVLNRIKKRIEKERALGSKRKIRILDLGGGAGVLADQIRKLFPNEVKVYSTGLTRKLIEKQREQMLNQNDNATQRERDFIEENEEIIEKAKAEGILTQKKISKDDLKWRSLVQLSDYPEFDFILDTYGEHMYMKYGNSEEVASEKVLKHVEMVIKKLQSGGYASIVPDPAEDNPALQEKLEALGERLGAIVWNKDAYTDIDKELGNGPDRKYPETGALKIIKYS